MFNFLNSNMLATLMDYLSNPINIVGLVIAIIGFALTILAKKITKVARKSNVVKDNDPIYLTILAFALVLILVGFIVSIFSVF